ncbi:uncharacterized protein LOC128725769 [Anopheles nili]|uniref:uncharacterized protein LOC128725769 n=1 Tax=Anopheles nili TaxID=185578 RepID=UPI00237C226D|nr:uncharacterized protein LOC128725769 [Anopheles nili]
MLHLWIVLLIFTTDFSFSDATIYGSINQSPQDIAAHGSSVRSLPGQAIDFIDTRPGGPVRERINETPGKHADLFSQLKHLQQIAQSDHRSVPSAMTESDLAGARRSLATVLQLLFPYGRPQQRIRAYSEDASGPFDRQDPQQEESFMLEGPDTTNYMLHGKLIEIGPKQRGPSGSTPGNAVESEERTAAPLDDTYGTVGQKRAAALRSTVARRSHILPAVTGGASVEDGSFMPSISVGEFYGALTNLGDFFQNLKHNLESLESKNLNNDQVKLLEGQNMMSDLRKGFFYSRVCRGLSQAGGQCRLPARHPELSALAPDSSAGVYRTGAVPWHQLSRSRVHACRTRKMSYPPTIRPPHSILLASC